MPNAGDPQLSSSLQELDDARLAGHFAGRGDFPIGSAPHGTRCEVHGEVREVRIVPTGPDATFEASLSDGSGTLLIRYPGGVRPEGVRPGSQIRVLGDIAEIDGVLTMHEPVVEDSEPAHGAT